MQIHATLQNTMIMITHDVDEAVLLSDRIVMVITTPRRPLAKEVLEILAAAAQTSSWL